MPLTASQPFVFTGCVEVRQALDHRATDERELLERLEEVPAGSVFYHTHGYFLRQRAITTVYGNDFASSVATQVRDQVLAERLVVGDWTRPALGRRGRPGGTGGIDPHTPSLERVRARVLALVDAALEGGAR